MKAIVIKSFGDPSGLAVAELPAPAPGPNEVVIAVEAIGVGGVDTLIRSGALSAYGFVEGHVPGGEVAGTVQELGADVDPAWRGRRVWVATGTGGGYAERVAAPAATLVPLPDATSAADAVTVGGSGAVAHFALRRAALRAGESVLVRGAAGGIGVMAVQLAAAGSAGVLAVTTSSCSRGDRLRALGATAVLDRDGAGRRQEPAASFDVIIDIVAGAGLPAFLARLTPSGRMVAVGMVGGPPPADFGMTVFGAFQRSTSFATFSTDTVPGIERAAAVADLFARTGRGELASVIDTRLPLQDAETAHRRMETGNVLGRIVLTP